MAFQKPTDVFREHTAAGRCVEGPMQIEQAFAIGLVVVGAHKRPQTAGGARERPIGPCAERSPCAVVSQEDQRQGRKSETHSEQNAVAARGHRLRFGVGL